MSGFSWKSDGLQDYPEIFQKIFTNSLDFLKKQQLTVYLMGK